MLEYRKKNTFMKSKERAEKNCPWNIWNYNLFWKNIYVKNDLTLFIQILLTKIYFGSMSFQFIKKCRIVKGSDGRRSKFCGKLESNLTHKKIKPNFNPNRQFYAQFMGFEPLILKSLRSGIKSDNLNYS